MLHSFSGRPRKIGGRLKSWRKRGHGVSSAERMGGLMCWRT
ncbi:hypothetical protein F7725_012947, partial [Dissostichus mawsoni]